MRSCVRKINRIAIGLYRYSESGNAFCGKLQTDETAAICKQMARTKKSTIGQKEPRQSILEFYYGVNASKKQKKAKSLTKKKKTTEGKRNHR